MPQPGLSDGVTILGQESSEGWYTVSKISDGSFKFNFIDIRERILIPITLALSVFIGLIVGIPSIIVF